LKFIEAAYFLLELHLHTELVDIHLVGGGRVDGAGRRGPPPLYNKPLQRTIYMLLSPQINLPEFSPQVQFPRRGFFCF
jgi:hypothetical protein